MSQRFSPTRLTELREAAGLSRTDVAFAARRSEQSVWLWERGKVTPPLEVLAQVASLIGCQVDDFLDGDGDV
jgi:transcriptional regulator with XRE-family HTH domain